MNQLKNQVKCLEIELEQKNAKLASLTNTSAEQKLEEKDLAIGDLIERCESLEKELMMAKAPMPGDGKKSKKHRDESDKLIADLTK